MDPCKKNANAYFPSQGDKKLFGGEGGTFPNFTNVMVQVNQGMRSLYA